MSIVLRVTHLGKLLPRAHVLKIMAGTAAKFVQIVEKYPCLYTCNLADDGQHYQVFFACLQNVVLLAFTSFPVNYSQIILISTAL